MKLKKIALGTLLTLVVAGTAGWFSLDKETRGLLKTFPTNRDLLFWNEAQRDAAFRALTASAYWRSGTPPSPRPRRAPCLPGSRCPWAWMSMPT